MTAAGVRPATVVPAMAGYLATGGIMVFKVLQLTNDDIEVAQRADVMGTWGHTVATRYIFSRSGEREPTTDQVAAEDQRFDRDEGVAAEFICSD